MSSSSFGGPVPRLAFALLGLTLLPAAVLLRPAASQQAAERTAKHALPRALLRPADIRSRPVPLKHAAPLDPSVSNELRLAQP